MVQPMSTDPKPPTVPARLSAKAAQLAAEAAASRASAALEDAAHGVLDDMERLLFGAVGGAEAAIRAEEAAGSALDRARAAHGLEAGPPPPPREDPVARARQQLAELKAARAAGAAEPERKKTL